ncbi:heterodisulfide reductase-related iron-sulfur binding cluster [Candidatus Chlorohelix sp.]|uniref:(Fe-S)-binding protein n=1 Tax=Candidatus Chlorohelix sp. TaxID=3139201 RepID=UPI0030699A3B
MDTVKLVDLVKDKRLPGFMQGEAPSYDDMTRCIHCGLCLNQCPTYRVTGNETESPRGRLYLMRAFAEGRISGQSESLQKHLNQCLQCRACESACPSGVKYGHLVELTSAEVAQQTAQKQSRTEKIIRWLVFRQLFPKPNNLRYFALATRFYQRSPIQKINRAVGFLRLPALSKIGLGKLADLEETLLPPISKPLFEPPEEGKVPALTEQKYRVALFSGCVMSIAFAGINEATVRVLTRNHCEVVVPESLNCCGALHVHNGDREYGKEMAIRNIEVFEESERKFGKFDAIIINAAGCGAMLKEYGELLKSDKAMAKRAEAFSEKVKDITEFLASIELNRNFGRINRRITYQDACHLLHGQKIQFPPRALLKAIPGIELVEMKDSDKCCGSAGIYNVTNSELSLQILDEKMENIADARPQCIIVANPGCHLQMKLGVKRAGLQKGLGKPIDVAHIVELLDEAYRAAEI